MIVKRLKEVIVHKGINKQKLLSRANLDFEELDRILNGDIPVNENFLKAVLEFYPEINANWLILGEGEMMVSNNSTNEKYVKNLDELIPEEILDYILTNTGKFRAEPKIDAIVNIFSNYEQQRELQKMYDKLERYKKLLEEKIGN